MKKTKITSYQLRKNGYTVSRNKYHAYWSKPIPNSNKSIVYDEIEKTIYLSNVFLNELRKVKYMEQINNIFNAITS